MSPPQKKDASIAPHSIGTSIPTRLEVLFGRSSRRYSLSDSGMRDLSAPPASIRSSSVSVVSQGLPSIFRNEEDDYHLCKKRPILPDTPEEVRGCSYSRWTPLRDEALSRYKGRVHPNIGPFKSEQIVHTS
jgi:hypothetical protein